MRIIGGRLRGREVIAPKTPGTRPMTDHDREALFNILGDIKGMKVLDCYAGSGAIGFEALSRGAVLVDAVEVARAAVRSIAKSQKSLGVEDIYDLFRQPLKSWLNAHSEKADYYNLIFADPPFDSLDVEVLQLAVPYLKAGGLLILKHDSKLDPPLLEIENVDSRKYGDTTITFYRKH